MVSVRNVIPTVNIAKKINVLCVRHNYSRLKHQNVLSNAKLEHLLIL